MGNKRKRAESLTINHIKEAIKLSEQNLPMPPSPLPLHEDLWEDYRKLFNLTEEEMEKYFIKTQFVY